MPKNTKRASNRNTDAEIAALLPAEVKLRCVHTLDTTKGTRTLENHEQRGGQEGSREQGGATAGGHVEESACELAGKTVKTFVRSFDDEARACPGCGYYREIVEVGS